LKKTLFTLLLLSTTIYGYVDSDLDGVEDINDRCPNTPLTDLADINGCSTESLVSPHHFEVVVGASYSEYDYQTLSSIESIATSLELNYYYKNFFLQISSAYFESNNFDDSGFYDSSIFAGYQLETIESLLLRLSLGVILPTYKTDLNNNNTDYSASASLSYNFLDVTLFGGYSYTIIGDDLVESINYKNTNSYNLGVGYYVTSQLYFSGAYNSSESIYAEVESIETLSLYSSYNINENYFTTLSYSYGLSESASKNYVSLRLGYTF